MFVDNKFLNREVKSIVKVGKTKSVCRAITCVCAVMAAVTAAYSPALLPVVSALAAAPITGIRFFGVRSPNENDWRRVADESYS